MAQSSLNIEELSYLEKIQLIRKYWQFAAICQFFLNFEKAYNFTEEFETEQLESALANNDKTYLEPLLLNLMKNLPGQRFIHLPVLDIQIKKECEKRDFSSPLLEEDHPGFNQLKLPDQIKLIHALTEWQLEDFEKVRAKVDEDDDCDEWRLESIGRDKRYNSYWLFDDNRLYKQKYQAPKKSKSVKKSKKNNGQEQVSSIPTDWELVCSTPQEWEQFPTQFENSRNLDEQYLRDFLIEHVLPKVLPALRSKDRQKKKEEIQMSFQPKRSSRLQAKELYRKEQEEEQRKMDLLDAMDAREKDYKDSKSEAVIQNIPNLNTREMRAKRRALLNEGRLEEVLQIERDGVLRTVFNVPDNQSKIAPKEEETPKDITENGNHENENEENEDNEDNEDSEEEWYFKCVCGAEGKNRDDGLMMIACERCGIWQHVQCQDFYADNHKKLDLSTIFFLCQECLMNKPTGASLASNLSAQLDNSSDRTMSDNNTPSNRTDITRESSQSVVQTLGYPLASLTLSGTDPNSPISMDVNSTQSNPE